jgi:phosphopantetheine adenylyltransferase
LQEPTAAESDPLMEAIVVSEETMVGAQQINEGRARRGFAPLQVSERTGS